MAATCSAFLNCVPEFLSPIPRDAHAIEAVRRQRPLLSHCPQSPAARAIAQISRRLHSRLMPAPTRAAGMR